MSLISLYLHIPFCQRKCPYCDFNTYAGKEARYRSFAEALALDLGREGERRGRPSVPTVFMGGGTPTVLEGEQLERIFAGMRQGFDLRPEAEITSEVNPGTVDQSRFETLRRLGVNRLSMGVQSFDDAELSFLGRIHDAEAPGAAVALARAAGFTSLNLDLIYGLPGQQPEIWRRTLERAIDLGPEHLSLYSLIVEPDTPLASWVARGQVPEPDPDLAADLYEMACERLSAAGYHHYEISNWAQGALSGEGLPVYACRHNLVYWRNESYLGFGPGAHSSAEGRRWSVARSVEGYVRSVQAGPLRYLAAGAADRDYEEEIPPPLAMGETMMLGLRLLEAGVNRVAFRERFGVDVTDVYPSELAALQDRGLLETTGECVRLTPQGWLLGNQVFAEFLPDAPPEKPETQR